MTSTAYHLIEIDPLGHVVAVRLLNEVADERIAEAQARRLAEKRIVELWHGMRLVRRFEPVNGDAPQLRF